MPPGLMHASRLLLTRALLLPTLLYPRRTVVTTTSRDVSEVTSCLLPRLSGSACTVYRSRPPGYLRVTHRLRLPHRLRMMRHLRLLCCCLQHTSISHRILTLSCTLDACHTFNRSGIPLVRHTLPPAAAAPTHSRCTGGNDELQVYTSDASNLRLESVGGGKKNLVIEAKYNPAAPEGLVSLGGGIGSSCCALGWRAGWRVKGPLLPTSFTKYAATDPVKPQHHTCIIDLPPCPAPRAALHIRPHSHLLPLLCRAGAGAQACAHRGPVQGDPRLGPVASLLVRKACLHCSARIPPAPAKLVL